MNAPVPWRKCPPEDRPGAHVAELLEQASRIREASQADFARAYQRLAQGTRRGWRWRFAGLGALAAATAIALFVLLGRLAGPGRAPGPVPEDAWHTVGLGDLGAIDVTPRTVLRLDPNLQAEAGEHRAYVLAGRAKARIARQNPRQPFVVVTPHVRVVVVGTRFSVDVAGATTGVSVEEGRVRVESMAGGVVTLGAGESIGSDDARLKGPLPEAEPPATSAGGPEPSVNSKDRALPGEPICGREPSKAERERCLTRLAGGDGLPAQNALYALASALQRRGDGRAALERWREYERRFPDGVLAPEVSIAILRELLEENRHAEALAEAETFRAHFPSDTREPEMALVRAKLFCTQFGRMDDALPAFEEALSARSRQLREDALYAKGACLELLSSHEAAAATWRLYLEEFPDGPHAQDVRARLAE